MTHCARAAGPPVRATLTSFDPELHAMLKYASLLAGLLLAAPAFGQDNTRTRPRTIPSGPSGSSSACRPAAASTPSPASSPTSSARSSGQPVVVENRTGQSGNIGAEYVFAAEPDGYTLLASQPAPLTVNVLLYKKINFEPTAFIPVAIMTAIPNTLTVRPDFPAKTMQEFIAYAKANPGKLNYASQGTGTTSHLTAELFGTQDRHQDAARALSRHGAGDQRPDLEPRRPDVHRDGLGDRDAQGRPRPHLAVTAHERSPLLPDIPTIHRVGRAGFHLRHLERDLGAAEDAGPRSSPSSTRRSSRC